MRGMPTPTTAAAVRLSSWLLWFTRTYGGWWRWADECEELQRVLIRRAWRAGRRRQGGARGTRETNTPLIRRRPQEARRGEGRRVDGPSPCLALESGGAGGGGGEGRRVDERAGLVRRRRGSRGLGRGHERAGSSVATYRIMASGEKPFVPCGANTLSACAAHCCNEPVCTAYMPFA
jgi:hypothetical protein